jgi:ribonucleoside-diphosphate reductase alpha chain
MKEPERHHLPDTRKSWTCRVSHSGDLDIYVTVGFFDTGEPGEVFVKIGKEGSTIAGMVDMMAVQCSLLLQYGVPWERIARKLRHTNFDPLNKEGKSIAHAIAVAVDGIMVKHIEEYPRGTG